jgi:cwf21 domain
MTSQGDARHETRILIKLIDFPSRSIRRLTEEEIQTKVDAYRQKLTGTNQNGNEATAKDEHGRPM